MSSIKNLSGSTKGVIIVNDKGVKKTLTVGPRGEAKLPHGFELFDDHPVMQTWLEENVIQEAEEAVNDEATEAEDGEGEPKPARATPRRRRR